MDASLLAQSKSLLAFVASQCSSGGGSFSSSIYDTAWLSMIQKPPGSGTWLFPECFSFILEHQLSTGAWASYASPVDGILNTAAALLSLKKHRRVCPDDQDLALRSQKAEAALRRLVAGTDISSSDRVGLELLVLNHLTLLETEGVILGSDVLDPRLLRKLRALRGEKLAKLPTSSVYAVTSTLHHSLEALIGYIDFNKVGRLLAENGSMLASPASTAAYLMYASEWDYRAESYLRRVLNRDVGEADGGVPSAWPTTNFEASWVWKGDVNDKWHIHDSYWMSLLSRAFLLFLERLRDKRFCDEVLHRAPALSEQIPVISLQILIKLLASQGKDGSWDGSCEITAHAVLSLSSISRFPWIRKLPRDRLFISIEQGKSFLKANREDWKRGQHLWIEKVTYSSNILSEAYCLAAAMVPSTPSQEIQVDQAFTLPDEVALGVRKAEELICRTPLLSQFDREFLRFSGVQAGYLFCAIRLRRQHIFPSTGERDKKYQLFTALIWTACSALRGQPVSIRVLCEMMELSMLIYEVDEFMEDFVEQNFSENFHEVDMLIDDICSRAGTSLASEDTGGYWEPDSEQIALSPLRTVLTRFVTKMLHHQMAISTPADLKKRLVLELKTFLLAHVAQAADNYRFRLQKHSYAVPAVVASHRPGETEERATAIDKTLPSVFTDHGRTFYSWGTNLYGTARTAYMAEDVCRHLASLCRMYNDYGSVARDGDEGNLNSLNFPEFHTLPCPARGDDTEDMRERMKSELMWIAEYERRGLEMAMAQLADEVGSMDLDTQAPTALRAEKKEFVNEDPDVVQVQLQITS
ncbi:hypothetical protein DL771_011600 [Monosporascus sp. 5C6A]|nr:hypothetical protein DL771_011600 [Monosporascus sp. 5C6A]